MRNTTLILQSFLFHAIVLILTSLFSIFYQYSVIKRLVYFLNAPHLKYTSSTIIITLVL